MLTSTFFAILLGFWACLYLCDVYFKTNSFIHRRYINFIQKSGINIGICQIRWYSVCLNRLFIKLGQWRINLLKIWFTTGVIITLFFMLISICLLSLMIINTIQKRPVEQQVLTPVMPGVNLPANQIGYYLFTLLICGIIHEFGHAIAAVNEKVKVHGFGIFVLGLYPGAFVDLSTEHLVSLSSIKQLRIYCAGVWHNIILVLLALLFRYILPTFLGIFYSTSNSIVVTSIASNSAVSGDRGLMIGDEIVSMNNCKIRNVADWSFCIKQFLEEKPFGYCVAGEFIKQHDISKSFNDCCTNLSSTHLCFKVTKPKLNFVCLPARSTSDRPTCKLHSDCLKAICVIPSFEESDNSSTRLLRILHNRRLPLLFLGHPLDLHYSLTLSDFVPKSMLIPLHAPYILETIANYVISLSGALALLNVVPCYALDGQHILFALLEYIFVAYIEKGTRLIIFTVILLFGTVLIATNVVIALWVLFH